MYDSLEEVRKAKNYLKTITNPCSVKIIEYLQDKEEGDTVNNIWTSTRISSQPQTSQTLNSLYAIGIVNRRRSKKNIYYSLNKKKVSSVKEKALEFLKIV